MRILVITNYYPPIELGGWEQLTFNVITKLIEHGHQVEVLTSNYLKELVKETENHIHRTLNLESYDPEKYHPIYTLTHHRQEQENYANLVNLVSTFNPDLIYINGMWNLPYSVARTAEDLAPGRVAYYLASYWPTEIDAHTAYWRSPAKNSFTKVLKSILGSLVQKTLLASSLRNQLDFQLVMCVSKFVQDYAVEEAGIPRGRTRVVHNGIDLAIFKFQESKPKNGRINLIYAGRLSPDKGVHTILESLGIIKSRRTDLDIELSIYGNGTLAYQARLEKLVLENNIDQNVRFQGTVPREDMPEVLAAHDVLIFPSIWAEPLARIIQEAMASGLVVIGTDTGGTREILHDNENGLVFNAGDAHMLAEKILKLSDDENLLKRFAKAGKKTVKEKFSLDYMVEEIEESFVQFLKSKEN